MNTRRLQTLSIVFAVMGVAQAQAGNQTVVQLPRVVVTGKSLPAKVAEQKVVVLPRVVVTASRRVDTQLASCAARGQADKARATNQQC
jgi:hypothetical protein